MISLSYAQATSVLKTSPDNRFRRSVFALFNAWFAEHSAAFADLLNAVLGWKLHEAHAARRDFMTAAFEADRITPAAQLAMMKALELRRENARLTITERARLLGERQLHVTQILGSVEGMHASGARRAQRARRGLRLAVLGHGLYRPRLRPLSGGGARKPLDRREINVAARGRHLVRRPSRLQCDGRLLDPPVGHGGSIPVRTSARRGLHAQGPARRAGAPQAPPLLRDRDLRTAGRHHARKTHGPKTRRLDRGRPSALAAHASGIEHAPHGALTPQTPCRPVGRKTRRHPLGEQVQRGEPPCLGRIFRRHDRRMRPVRLVLETSSLPHKHGLLRLGSTPSATWSRSISPRPF